MVVETVAYVNGVAVLHTRSPTNEHRTRTYTVPTRTNKAPTKHAQLLACQDLRSVVEDCFRPSQLLHQPQRQRQQHQPPTTREGRAE